MVLRIEDTDAERSRPELVDAIYEALEWLGIDWDGEPVHQSDRTDLYRAAAERLLAAGAAYRCDCTQDDVKARATAEGRKTPGYDGFCRDRGVPAGPGAVVRFRVPDEGTTAFTDLVRGEVSFENANLEDFVIVRSNGVPMFLLANAVDDADLGITHIIRGEDLVNTTPKVLLLREALGPRLRAAVRPPAPHREREAPEAVEASRRRVGGRLHRSWLPARGPAQLPRHARLGPARRDRDPSDRRDRLAVLSGRRDLVERLLRSQEARPLRRRVRSGPRRRRLRRTRASPGCRASGGIHRRGLPPTTTRRCSPSWLRWCRSAWCGSTRFPATSTSCSCPSR